MPTIIVDDAEAAMISTSPVVDVRNSSGQLLGLVTGSVLTHVENARDRDSADVSMVRQIANASTLQELFAIANAAPDQDEEYDLLRALEENRVLSGDNRRLPSAGE